MNTHTLFIAIVISGLLLPCAGLSLAQDSGSIAPIYNVIPLMDAEHQLLKDASILNLDLDGASVESNHLGWYIFSTKDFEIRRLMWSGYFAYVKKNPLLIQYAHGKEPYSDVSLKEHAMWILTDLGLPLEEVYDAKISRIAEQAEDVEGKDVGPEMTVGYIINVKRQIQGVPVIGSDAKVVLTADGELQKIRISWRQIQKQPIAFGEKKEENRLQSENYSRISGKINFRQPEIYNEFYTFVEDHHKSEQATFVLKYVTVYTDEGSPPMVETTDAMK